MDIATIAARTGVPPRRLRYVLEHVMLPGISRTGEGPGVTRDFVASQAFAVALTALLFEAGLGQKSVKRCVDRFSARHTDKWGNAHQALFKRLFRDETISHLEIADAKNTRVIYRKENGKGFSVARWIQRS